VRTLQIDFNISTFKKNHLKRIFESIYSQKIYRD